MPVRSFNSVVLKWPGREEVLAACRAWAVGLRADPAVDAAYCVGSYARGDWGVGSDADLLVILSDSALSSLERYLRYSPADLPVPFDLWVLTRAERQSLAELSPHLHRRIETEAVDLLSASSV